MKKIVLLLLFTLCLTGCGDKNKSPDLTYKDGEYSAESSKDEWGGKTVLTVTIKDGKIKSCKQENLTGEGKEKDQEYGKKDGKITNPGLYKIAQDAVESAKEYPKMLVEKQDINQVEVISGATISHKAFVEATNKILEEASK